MGESVSLGLLRPALPAIDTRRFTQEDHPPAPRDIYEVFPASTSLDEDAILNIRPAWKRELHFLLERPTTSQPAFIVHVFTTFLIVLSAVITILETVPAFHSIPLKIWFGMESTLVALFTIEYIARCVAWSFEWRSLFRWVVSFHGIIDLLSVLPYYIELILRQDTSEFFRFSILRMFRLVRVFRPFRYNHSILMTIEVMYVSVQRSQHALLAIGFFVIMILTVFSTLLYFAERGTWDEILNAFINADGDPTQFSSIPAAAWFVVVTITTVGYGEITPRSFLGRLITIPILVFGLLLITLPSFVLGREFSLVWQVMVRKRAGVSADDDLPIDDPYNPSTPFLYPPPVAPLPPSQDHPTHQYPPNSSHHRLYPSSDQPPLGSAAVRDLSNMKLAQNQTALSDQIAELRGVVEEQAVLVRRLVGMLERGRRRRGQEGEDEGEGEEQPDGSFEGRVKIREDMKGKEKQRTRVVDPFLGDGDR